MDDQLSADLASLRISRDEPPPPRKMWRWVVAALAVAALAFGIRSVAWPYAEARLFKTEVTVSEIALVSPAQAIVDVTATGYVVPQVVAKVGAKVTGRISKVGIREGQRVKAGDVLFEMDPSDQLSSIASAEARVAAALARATAERAKAQVARANVLETKQQYERERRLAETGATNPATADDLAARAKALEEQVKAADEDAAAAEAEAAASRADTSALRVNLDNLTIRAPIDGTATTKPAQMGDVVSPASSLVDLADFSSLLVEVDVPEARLGLLKRGGPCEIVLDAYPDKRQRGEIVDFAPQLDRAKATGVAKVKFVDGLDDVLPEMAARVSFLGRALDPEEMKAKPKKIVPRDAVVDREGAKVVYVVDGDHVRLTTIAIGAPASGGFELEEGPSAGTKVVKSPPPSLADGQAVKEKGGE
jgi:HlyD family secretion protein